MNKFQWINTIKTTTIRMRILGLWPKNYEVYKLDFYTCWSAFCITAFTTTFPVFGICKIFYSFDDLEAILSIVYLAVPCLFVAIKAFLVVKNMKILKRLMVILDSDLFQPRNQHQVDLFEDNSMFWKFCSFVIWTMTAGAVVLLSSYPILDGSSKEHRLPLLSCYPLDIQDLFNYEIAYFHQVVGCVFCGFTAVAVDTLIAAFHMFIGAQFDILYDDIKHVFDFSENFLEDLDRRLIKCITHHRAILRFADDFSRFSNWIIFGQFFISAVSIGITMFLLTRVPPFSNEFLFFLSFLAAITCEIFIYCWFGNEVEMKSIRLPYAVFESEWLNVPSDLKKLAIILTERCQRPLKICTLNLFYLSLETFIKILRAAWSYFALLNQVQN